LRQFSCDKILQSQTVTREKLQKTLLYKKGLQKMLIKLTPGGLRNLRVLNKPLCIIILKIGNFRKFCIEKTGCI